MPTSGVITGTDVVSEIIRDALMELQVLSANQQPSANDAEMMRRRLNWMLKDWQNDGVNLWRQEAIDITWPAATAEGDLVGVNEIVTLRVVVSATNQRPLTRWSLSDYLDLPDKTTAGTPTIYAVTRETTGVRLRLWPVPSAITTLKATQDRRIEDVVTLTEEIDVPQQYTRTVMMCLAASAAPAFGRANDPNGVFVIREAARLYQILRANDRPSSYFLKRA